MELILLQNLPPPLFAKEGGQNLKHSCPTFMSQAHGRIAASKKYAFAFIIFDG
jgi:hypothetical protein